MTADYDISLEETDKEFARVLFVELVLLHPTHLTMQELIRWMTFDRGGVGDAETQDAIYELRRSGLLRANDGVFVPTFVALRAADILGL